MWKCSYSSIFASVNLSQRNGDREVYNMGNTWAEVADIARNNQDWHEFAEGLCSIGH